jgi:type IV secretory pathway VirB2 component (pilin)
MKKKKILSIIAICLLILIFGINLSYAKLTDFNVGATTDTNDLNEVKNTLDVVISIVCTVGSGISIIALIILGIKYMMGSIEEKATYKKTLLPYVIGACLLFGASLITSTLYKMFK